MADPIARSTVTSLSPRPPARHRRWLLAAALASATLAPGLAQAASCTGVPEWNGNVIYLSGSTLQKGGVLYRANQDIWNAPPDHPAGAPYYTNLGACDSGGSNQAPSVSLTSPANGASFAAGSTITVSANASDADGTVSKVEFFRGGTSLGIDTSAPYSVT
ncbi:MAG: Ig-like domain-containing protein, partial [Stenotrophomonas sp.]